MNHLTIDQSGKIEDTTCHTILAFSNKLQYAIMIPKDTKQKIFSSIKKSYKKRLTIRLYSYGLYRLLLNKITKSSRIILDDEYPGHARDIKKYLVAQLELENWQIDTGNIGKKDPAHKIAYKTYKGQLKPNDILRPSIYNLYSESKIRGMLSHNLHLQRA